MAERIPPQSLDAEKSVLGSCMLSKDALYSVMEVVRASDFYSKTHEEIFKAITNLYRQQKPVDSITVIEELKKGEALDLVGGRAYVLSLSADIPSTANAQEYGKIVAEKSALRALISASSEIIEVGYQEKVDAAQAIDLAEKKIFAIAQSRQTNEVSPLKDILLANIDTIDKNAKLGGEILGVSTGFSDYDKKFGGFQESELIILAARPSMGKTAFALNMAQQAALKAGAKVLFFSLEMPEAQIGMRFLSMEARVDTQKLKRGDLNTYEWEQLSTALDTLSKGKVFVDDTPGITVAEIKNKCRRIKAEEGLDIVFIDYLQMMSFEGKAENRQQEISTLSRYLKQLAREIECPVVVLSQLSRAPENRSDRRPILSDLRESGSIEQDADIVIFLYRDDYYAKEESLKPGICEVDVAKNRTGPTGKVELTWVSRYTKFEDKSNLEGDF